MIKETTTLASEREEVLKNNLEYTLFSWSKQKGIDPICVQRAVGVYLYDYDGKRYLDFSSGLMNVNIGHGDQRVTDAVVKQMQLVSYVTPSCATQVRGELGKKLAEICPGNLNKAHTRDIARRIRTECYSVVSNCASNFGAFHEGDEFSSSPTELDK